MAQTEQTTQDLRELDDIERRMFSLGYAITDIMFNGATVDPRKGAPARGEALATLDGAHHELLCSDELGALLGRLEKAEGLDETQRARLRVLGRDRARETNVPAEVAADFTRLTVESADVWHRAKPANDWESFEPYLQRVVDSMRTIAGYKDPSRDPYDVWLDEFEPGTSRAFYDRFFDAVRECVVPLVTQIRERGWQPDRSCIEGSFDDEAQWRLARDIVELEGLDMDALVLARTEHPFSDSVSSGHAFIASHVYEDDVMSNVFSMLHEGGHALYEQGVDPAYDYNCLRGGTSMGIHEAQSRFFENYVGRSEAFAGQLLSLLGKRFPGRFDGVSEHDLYLACNRAEPSLVRTEADELTYPLHVLVRYEIEQRLFSGEATAADVPGLWADGYRRYLGIEVPNHTLGCLQDTHWADGSIGYFPTYALGSAYGAQFHDRMVEEGMDFDGLVARAELAPIREWLGSRIWRWGRSMDPAELVESACGTPFDPTHYTDYLTRKFSAIYGL